MWIYAWLETDSGEIVCFVTRWGSWLRSNFQDDFCIGAYVYHPSETKFLLKVMLIIKTGRWRDCAHIIVKRYWGSLQCDMQ